MVNKWWAPHYISLFADSPLRASRGRLLGWTMCHVASARGVPPYTPAVTTTVNATIPLQPVARAARFSTWATGRGGSAKEMRGCGGFQVAPLGHILSDLREPIQTNLSATFKPNFSVSGSQVELNVNGVLGATVHGRGFTPNTEPNGKIYMKLNIGLVREFRDKWETTLI